MQIVNLGERLFFAIVWILLILVLAGFLLHLMAQYGIFPGLVSWIAERTNISAQAGG